MRIIVSGFEPFGEESVNPAALVAGRLDGWEPAPGFEVESVVVPVTWEGAVERLVAELAAPAGAVVMLGQAGGYAGPGLERVAVNLCNGKDNAGVERTEQPVVPGGPPAYFSTLPLLAIAGRIEALGLPVFISNSAGVYLCNFLFYGVMHHLAAAYARGVATKAPLAGFIHVPYLPEQALGKKPLPPSMSLADIERSVRAAVEAVAEFLARPAAA